MSAKPSPSATPVIKTRRTALAVAGLILFGLMLALTSAVRDSVTFDEPLHLAAGYSYLHTGDFRLGPDHPPLGKLWAALPLLFQNVRWPDEDTPGWRNGNGYAIGPTWLFELNDGQQLVSHARCMVIALLGILYVLTYGIARRLFGARAGLLALAIAVLSPTLLAHGRLVTMDLPATLAIWLTIAAFARLLRRLTLGNLLLAGAALSAASLVKYSWPLVLPALLLMGCWSLFTSREWVLVRPRFWQTGESKPFVLRTRLQRLFALLAISAGSAVIVWLAVWTCYGWRYRPFVGSDREQAFMAPFPDALPYPHDMAGAWHNITHTARNEPITGVTASLIDWARRIHFLPEPYLFGLAFQRKATLERRAYLMGEISSTGWTSYFPIAFAIKTPVASLLLFGVGIAALIAKRKTPTDDPALLIGVCAFAIVYAFSAITSRYNIGQRHLLPLYPAVAILAAAGIRFTTKRWGRWLIGLCLAWLALANVLAYPDYLSYFNELIGGSRNGYRFLADSNIDWGQDLLRLKAWAERHPQTAIKLAYHGSANPRFYVPRAEMLLSEFNIHWGPQAPLTPGAYVVSVTQLLGVYNEAARPEYWRNETNRTNYLSIYAAMARHQSGKEALPPEQLARVNENLGRLQPSLLISRLAPRPPDERIGRSLFVYELTETDIRELTFPPRKP